MSEIVKKFGESLTKALNKSAIPFLFVWDTSKVGYIVSDAEKIIGRIYIIERGDMPADESVYIDPASIALCEFFFGEEYATLFTNENIYYSSPNFLDRAIDNIRILYDIFIKDGNPQPPSCWCCECLGLTSASTDRDCEPSSLA